MKDDKPYTEGEYEDDSLEYADGRYDDTAATENESRWGDGLVSLLLLGGAALFLFPEPSTSVLGILLVVAGVVLWAVNALR